MTILTSEPRRIIYRRPDALADRSTHYCPGCGHGIVHRLVAELLDELDLTKRTIGVASVGCSVFAYDYFTVDFVESPHGRAPAVATGVRRMRPDAFVFTYQGDGDLAAIGTAEIVGAAARGERFSVVFVNNGIYGMTGGQMAPTTLLGQRTTSSPLGREPALGGFPIPITEMLALMPGVSYAARGLDRRSGRRRADEGAPASVVREPAVGRRDVDRRGPVDVPGRLGPDADRIDGAPRPRRRQDLSARGPGRSPQGRRARSAED